MSATRPIICQCGHQRGDHGGMGPSRGKPIMSACGACGCQQWRPALSADVAQMTKRGMVTVKARGGGLIWRDEAQAVVARVFAENAGADDKTIARALRAAYQREPFCGAKGWPFQVWRDEVHVAMGLIPPCGRRRGVERRVRVIARRRKEMEAWIAKYGTAAKPVIGGA